MKKDTPLSNLDKIIRALSKLTMQSPDGGFVTLLHDEAKGYAFKIKDEWKRVSFEFANEFAGLGAINRSLI